MLINRQMYSIFAMLSRKISVEASIIKLAALKPQLYAPSVINHVNTHMEYIISTGNHKMAYNMLKPICESPPKNHNTLNDLITTVQSLLNQKSTYEYELLAISLFNSSIVTKNIRPALKLLCHQYSYKNRELLHKYTKEVKQMLNTRQDWPLIELTYIGTIISGDYDPTVESKFFELLEQCLDDPMVEVSCNLLVANYELICAKCKHNNLQFKCFGLLSKYFFDNLNIQLSDIMRIVVASAKAELHQAEIWEQIKWLIQRKMYTIKDIEETPYILTFAQAYAKCPYAYIPTVFIEAFKSYYAHQKDKLNKGELTYIASIFGSFEEYALQAEAHSQLNAIPKT
jgi:hypothetical protein